MYTPVSNKSDFSSMEHEVLAFWKEDDTFKKSLEKPTDKQPFVFYDGPPFATGLPHYGHLLAGIIKDIVPRYQTMRGRRVERRFGWDCHGLPIEALAQEALGVSGAGGIAELGVDKFNEQCRSMVLRYVEQWRETVTRIGRWVDFDNDYKTMQPSFMESVWWVFKQLWDAGRVYKSYRIMPYSWKLNTPLSNFEAGNNYKDVQDPAITVRVRVLGEEKTYFLIWTTTPWTLPENLAICAGPDIDYIAARDKEDGSTYILAEARLSAYYKNPEAYEIVERFKGRDLLGKKYEPIFPYFKDRDAFRVLNGDFVTTSDGTGLVHIAPAYGEDDFQVCRAAGIELVDGLDENCAFTNAVPDYAGRFCKDADKDIIRALKQSGQLVHQTTIVHSYPFCDRTDTPLIYRAIEAWYVKVEDLHERLSAANEKVRWTPEYVGSKRFGNWLGEARDWNISRNRFWGSCIPVWINEEDPSDCICVGSIAELEELSGEKVTDLHKHFVDKILIKRDGKTYRRTPEVLDCWFESGSMPYAQQHYPFSGAESKDFFPADFIAEGLDQTRGWFYTLLILGVHLFGEAPYRNVIVNGLVLAEDGKKMSKRLKNYPDPREVVEKYGADALRLYMINSPVVRAENLRFAENGVKQVLRDILIPWWNAYAFFVTYANVDGWDERATEAPSPAAELDRWIISSLETLITDVRDALDNYDLQRAVRPFVQFINDLTNWYIRRSRRRFWKSQNDADKDDAYRTLRYVLLQLCKVAAPFTPFISETIYRNLRSPEMPQSVHLCDFPAPNASARDAALERRMALVQTVVGIGRQIRTEHDLKVRQPLATIHIASTDAETLKALQGGESLITDELNIKEVSFDSDPSALADLQFKADFRKLGPRVGSKMKAVAAAIAKLKAPTAELTLDDGTSVALETGDLIITRIPRAGLAVGAEGDIVVALETELTPELIAEGHAREFVNRIQNMRKDAGFEVSQRIAVRFAADAELAEALNAHAAIISAEVLATSLTCAEALENAAELDLNGHSCRVEITKA